MRIKLENIWKVYKEVDAVKELNIEIEDGTLVCILGPSGCGKSTTLSMIAGLDMPTKGKIYFDGVNVSNIEAERRDIGMVFQDYALYPHMTVMENIAFPLKMRSIKKKDRIDKVKEVAKMLQIEEFLQRKPSKLSGGQQQRVAIARALVKNPKILLLDEPLSNLDARLRIELREEIRRVQRKLGITTIFVTHDQEEALSISDKILILNHGIMQQYSSPKEMYMMPENKFVAGFLGNPPMNFVMGKIKENKIYMFTNGGEIEIQCNDINFVKKIKNGTCIIGIRPEDLMISDKGNIGGKIEAVQTLGKEVYINFQMENQNLTACVSWDNNYEYGDTLHFKVKRAHVFQEKVSR